MSTNSKSLATSPAVEVVPQNDSNDKRPLLSGSFSSTIGMIVCNMTLFVFYSLGSLLLDSSDFSTSIRHWLIFVSIHLVVNISIAIWQGFKGSGSKFALSAAILFLIALASGGEAALRAFGF